MSVCLVVTGNTICDNKPDDFMTMTPYSTKEDMLILMKMTLLAMENHTLFSDQEMEYVKSISQRAALVLEYMDDFAENYINTK